MIGKYFFSALALLVFVATGIFLVPYFNSDPTAPDGVLCTMEAKICPDGSAVGRSGPNCEFAECPASPAIPPKDTAKTLPYGEITLRAGESANFADISLTFLRVTDDSRCPSDVTCVWAGTLHAEFAVTSSSGESVKTIELGNSATSGDVNIALLAATPYPRSSASIAPNDYRLTLSITKKKVDQISPPAPIPPPQPEPTEGACRVGGCSGEICSDKPDMASICLYREEFACYKSAICERGSDGACGWRKTNELEMCLAKPSAN